MLPTGDFSVAHHFICSKLSDFQRLGNLLKSSKKEMNFWAAPGKLVDPLKDITVTATSGGS